MYNVFEYNHSTNGSETDEKEPKQRIANTVGTLKRPNAEKRWSIDRGPRRGLLRQNLCMRGK